MRILKYFLLVIVITSCQQSNDKEKADSVDKIKEKTTDNSIQAEIKHSVQILNKIDFHYSDDHKTVAIKINDNFFDIINLVSYNDKFYKLKIEQYGDYRFVIHLWDGIYFNFMGLIDVKNKKWILKYIGVEDSTISTSVINPTLLGISPDQKHFLLSFGDVTEDYCKIYDMSGDKVFDFINHKPPTSWTSDNKIIYWSKSKIDTLPKLGVQEIWMQKTIWKDNKIKKVNEFKKGFEQ